MEKRIFSGILFCVLILFSCKTKEKQTDELFTSIDEEYSGITFANELHDTPDQNIIQYLYYYNGGGVSIGDINNDGLPDLFFTGNQVSNRLYLNTGDLTFKDVTEEAGLLSEEQWSTGSTMADINADGYLDIYICQVQYKSFQGANRLYINNGKGVFEDQTDKYGLTFKGLSTHAAFFDYDLDGDLDLYILNHSTHSPENYVTAEARLERDSLAGDVLMRNDDGHFIDVTTQSGIYASRIGYGLGLTIRDINGDLWPDILVANDFHENDYLYLNQKDGTFRESSDVLRVTSNFSMGNAVADLNNDLLPDIVTLDMKPSEERILKSTVGTDPYEIYQFKRTYGYHYQLPRNTLHLQQASSDTQLIFLETAQWAGLDATDWSWAVLPTDFDLDGWNDLFITNGIKRRPNDLDFLKYMSDKAVQAHATDSTLASRMPEGAQPNCLFVNTQFGFRKDTLTSMSGAGYSNGAAYADLDRDGDLDLVINNLNARASILRNNASTHGHFLVVDVQKENQSPCIGARVEVYADSTKQVKEVAMNLGYLSSTEPRLHFGLGERNVIDSIVVYSPYGDKKVLRNVASNTFQKIMIDGKGNPGVQAEKSTNAVQDESLLVFTHRENSFSDKKFEPLIPWLLSREGPCMATGDVNSDGLTDVYMGGARDQGGSLFVQNANGGFTETLQTVFDEFIAYEQTGAVFTDIDGDKDQDLIIAMGGNESDREPRFYQPLILLNANGEFSKKHDLAVPVFLNASVVRANDFDKDGDNDLFFGGRSVPGNYGMPAESFLLMNDGHGHLDRYPGPPFYGMVTDAQWADLDKNGWDDLILVGEWMPITLFYSNGGLFRAVEIEQSEGFWFSVYAGDVDQDGYIDLVTGNLGKNSALQGDSAQGNHLYLKDFDANNKLDPVITYYRGGVEYPFYSRDEIMNQLTYKRKQFAGYQDYAQKAFTDLFSEDERVDARVFQVRHYASKCWFGTADGSFTPIELPAEMQWSPIFEIVPFEINDTRYLFCAGNIEFADPAIGTMRNNIGSILSVSNQRKMKHQFCSRPVAGDVRAVMNVNVDGEPNLIIGINNEPVFTLATKEILHKQ